MKKLIEISFEGLELEELRLFVERCQAELERRKGQILSEEDVMLALSVQQAAYRRQKEREERDLLQIFKF